MLYSATHHIYSDTTGHECGETRTFGTPRAARLWAKSILPQSHQVSDENYWTDMGRCSTVVIESNKTRTYTQSDGYDTYTYTYTKPVFRTTVYPRIDIVPSSMFVQYKSWADLHGDADSGDRTIYYKAPLDPHPVPVVARHIFKNGKIRFEHMSLFYQFTVDSTHLDRFYHSPTGGK